MLDFATVEHPQLWAGLVCAGAVIGEGLFMGRQGSRWMRGLRQPRLAPPAWLWGLIGLAYYGICYYALARILAARPIPLLCLVLLLTLLAANTFWNYIYFRRHDLRLVFWYSVGYAVLAVALLIALLRADVTAASVFGFYVIYLPYALVLFYRTWKLNEAASDTMST
jgi:tryptophan-rich sensory protein